MPDWVIWAVALCVALVIGYVLIRLGLRRLRRWMLMRLYGDAEMVATILSGEIAQGMSAEMVIDAWGQPADMDEKVMKTKTKREMKYDQTGKNRFGTRVYLENGAVVGWETK